MDTRSSQSRSKQQELLDALRTARDTVRVQAHLFSLEARERWQELEDRLLNAEAKLEQGGESVVESISEKVDDLVRAAKDVLQGANEALDVSAPVAGVMTKDPVTCSPDDSLSRAAAIMWESDCGAVPVVNPDGTLAGMITDRDICMATFTRGQAPSSLDVRSAMAKTVYRLSPNDPIARVVRIMAEQQVRRIPIVENGRVVGIVAVADLARYIRSSKSDNLPACVTFTHALARISEHREQSSEHIAAE
jgi:CBS domain-containing protein